MSGSKIVEIVLRDFVSCTNLSISDYFCQNSSSTALSFSFFFCAAFCSAFFCALIYWSVGWAVALDYCFEIRLGLGVVGLFVSFYSSFYRVGCFVRLR